MLYPCIVIVLFLFFDTLQLNAFRSRYISVALSLSVIVIFTAHFLSILNFKYCYEWKEQAESKDCFDFLVEMNARHVLTHEWHYGVYLNYYKVLNEAKYSFEPEKINPVEVASVSDEFYNKAKQSDYVLILPPYNLETMRSKGLKFTVLKKWPITGSIVMKFSGEDKKNEHSFYRYTGL